MRRRPSLRASHLLANPSSASFSCALFLRIGFSSFPAHSSSPQRSGDCSSRPARFHSCAQLPRLCFYHFSRFSLATRPAQRLKVQAIACGSPLCKPGPRLPARAVRDPPGVASRLSRPPCGGDPFRAPSVAPKPRGALRSLFGKFSGRARSFQNGVLFGARIVYNTFVTSGIIRHPPFFHQVCKGDPYDHLQSHRAWRCAGTCRVFAHLKLGPPCHFQPSVGLSGQLGSALRRVGAPGHLSGCAGRLLARCAAPDSRVLFLSGRPLQGSAQGVAARAGPQPFVHACDLAAALVFGAPGQGLY